jgi:hypothetical protein
MNERLGAHERVAGTLLGCRPPAWEHGDVLRFWRRKQAPSSDQDAESPPRPGDQVRILVTPETVAAGCAGLSGTYCGFTTPSFTGIEVVGLVGDLGYNVLFEDERGDAWVDPTLVELVGFDPEGSMVIGDRRFVRDAGGEWIRDPG